MVELLGSDYVVEVVATDGWGDPNPNTKFNLGSLDGYFDGSNDDKIYWFNTWFFVSFTHSLTPLVGSFQYRRVHCLLFCSKIIVAKKYYCDGRCFTKIYKDVRISLFGVCCPVAKKVFR